MSLEKFFLIIGCSFILNSCTTLHPTSSSLTTLKTLDKTVGQAIVVEDLAGSDVPQTLTLWEKKNGQWKSVFKPMLATAGRKGFAPEGEKREGDGRTPSGVYPLGIAFGYAPSVKTKLNYRQVSNEDFWVDDSESPQYNQWVKGSPQAKSFERLKRDDDLYKYGIVIEYNTNPIIPGKGSAIFMHVWRGLNYPTAGCVAISERNMIKILSWLDPSQNPVIKLGSLNEH